MAKFVALILLLGLVIETFHRLAKNPSPDPIEGVKDFCMAVVSAVAFVLILFFMRG